MGRPDMIEQEFYLPEYDWNVKVIYIVQKCCTDYIMDELKNLKCSARDQKTVLSHLQKQNLNEGFTYTTKKSKGTMHSIVYIGKTTNAEEFQDTLNHEKCHLVMHICDYKNIDPFGEKMQYLDGEISKILFRVSRVFLCDDCRKRAGLDN